MDLREHTYSVLVVSDAAKVTSTLRSLMPESHFSPVRVVKSVSAAKRVWSDRSYDLVIINTPLPDGMGRHFAIDVSDSSEAVVLLLVQADVQAEVREKVVEHGVFTLAKPTSRDAVTHALDWMTTARERLRRVGKKTLSFEEKMAEIRLVNRAKWLLISDYGMSEPDAHRYLEKAAMDRGTTKGKVAEEVIRSHG